MIIEFELLGSKCLHKGMFDTTGFWLKYEPEYEEAGSINIVGYKLYSHFSFAFYHEDKDVVDLVMTRLAGVFRGAIGHEIEGVGYIRRLNK